MVTVSGDGVRTVLARPADVERKRAQQQLESVSVEVLLKQKGRLQAELDKLEHWRASVVKVLPWQCPSSAPAPPHWAPSRPIGHPATAPDARATAASNAAHFSAFDHPGAPPWGAPFRWRGRRYTGEDVLAQPGNTTSGPS